MTHFLVLLSFLLPVPTGIRKQLDDIHREYLSGPDVASLVALDAKIRKLIEEPWKRDRKSIDVQKTNPSWAAVGVEMAHFSESLVYSGKLLVEAHRKNPSSGLRKFTLFAEVMGERPSHGMGEMPNVNAAMQYLREFPDGPFARETAIILGNFYSDLFKVVAEREKHVAGYKYDCFRKYIGETDYAAQAEKARGLSVSYYARALANAPAGWQETIELAKRHSAMKEGNLERIESRGWSFCAD